jgi:hypothetical protein
LKTVLKQEGKVVLQLATTGMHGFGNVGQIIHGLHGFFTIYVVAHGSDMSNWFNLFFGVGFIFILLCVLVFAIEDVLIEIGIVDDSVLKELYEFIKLLF